MNTPEAGGVDETRFEHTQLPGPTPIIYKVDPQYGDKKVVVPSLDWLMISPQPHMDGVQYDRPRRQLKLLPTWRRLHRRHPIAAAVLPLFACTPVLSLVISLKMLAYTKHPPTMTLAGNWVAIVLSIVAGAAVVLVIGMLAELLDADRAMRVRFKMRTGEDYDADPLP